MTWEPWHHAWQSALYGDGGFYLRPEGPAGHFRTACHAAPDALAVAVTRLAAEHGCTTIVDVGAGRGELAASLARCAEATDVHGLHAGHAGPAVHGVDVVERPPTLPAQVGWTRSDGTPDGVVAALRSVLAGLTGPVLVTAFELLDVVPCRVVEVDDAGAWREVEVDPATGRERLGARLVPDSAVGAADTDDLTWLRRWWPVPSGGNAIDDEDTPEGMRAEIGRPRDAVWAGLVAEVAAHPRGGALLAVDYVHTHDTRPAEGSLSGFVAGREIPARPDGRSDVTAHVAIDSVADAGRRAGATTLALLRQDDALWRWWPASAPGEPPAELLDPGSLGGFRWLVQAVARA